MMSVSMFPLDIGELGLIADIHADCFDDSWDAPVLRRILSMQGAFGIVARRHAGGAIMGFALARVSADECELLSLGVAPDHRGQGVGSRLLDTAMVRALSVNAPKFFLEVAENNNPARKLYAGRGLVQVGRRPRYYELGNGQFADALTMRCDLTGAAGQQAAVTG